MAKSAASTLAAVLLVTLVPSVVGHGYIVEPPARNVIFHGPRNGYCPHCGNGGGVCGDGGQWPGSSNYLGGENKGPQRTYTAGEVVEFEVKITAHHMGHFELHICDEHLGPLTPDPEGPSGCLSRWVLERVPPESVYTDCRVNDPRDDCQPLDQEHPERWYLSPGSGTKKMHFRIPTGLSCSSCTLQWRWWTANSCVPADGYGCYFKRMNDLGWNAGSWIGSWIINSARNCGSALLQSNTSLASSSARRGCGEEFRNCADITVLGSGGPSPSPTPSPAPTPSPSPSPVPGTTTAAPTPAPAGSCVQNKDCVANAWCQDPAYAQWCGLHSAAQCPSPQCTLSSQEPTPAPAPTPSPTTMSPTTLPPRTPVSSTLAPMTTMPPTTTAVASGAWTKHAGANCYTGSGASSLAGVANPLEGDYTLEQCQQACADQQGCEGVVFPRSASRCYLRRAFSLDSCRQGTGFDAYTMTKGTSEPEPEPESTTPSMVDPRCQECEGESPCIWTDGQCYPLVAQSACEGTSGAVWCGAPGPASAMQVLSSGPQGTRKKAAVHSHSFLAPALIQAGAALERAVTPSKAVEEL